MKSKFKIVSVLLSVLTAFGCLWFVGCGKSESAKHSEYIDSIGGVSETYEGSISDTEYNSKESAASAYVADEIVGKNNVTVDYVQSQGALTQTEIDAVIPASLQKEIESVEKMSVSYSANGTSSAGLYSANDQTTTTVTVYVVKYPTYWKYYSPAPITGETITKSYYDSVFDSERYKNCTYTTSTDMTVKVTTSVSGFSVTIKINMSIDQTLKFADGKIYLKQSITTKVSPDYIADEIDLNGNETLEAYVESDSTGGMKIYVKENDGRWFEGGILSVGFDSVDELSPFFDKYLDYTYFTKTDYGFELSGERAAQYIDETLDFEGLEDFIDFGDDFDFNIICKYYVSNGVLTGFRQEGNLKMNYEEEGVKVKASATFTGINTCGDYGMTVVLNPVGQEY